MREYVLDILSASWHVLLDSSFFILFGLAIAGLIRVFLDASAVARHLGRGRFLPVFKAALLGVPLPL
ncbi:MAG: hypothetical protein QNJ48_14315 [Desulfobacterales bacterium]|nr:hypothetical protein [Desulfobacterales bacterium]